MSHDPRQIHENYAIGEPIPRRAPQDKYRVIGSDTFAGDDWLGGDFGTKGEACAYADKHGGTMCVMCVYDGTGKHVYKAGTF